MSPPVFFTIVSRNYLAYALTLMQSVAARHPDSKRYLCLADDPADDTALTTDLFEVVPITSLSLPHFQSFVFRYDIMELNTAVKPYMFAWLRELHPHAGIIYLDPDILVLRKLEKVQRAFARGALAVLTPHLTAPIEDDKFPDELAIMRSGVYNCGFAAINAAHERAGDLIAWWQEKLEFGCFVDLEGGLFTDQKWVDLVPGMFPDVAILRDDGYNVAYWNLAQRPVVRASDGGYTANGSQLVFVHFSGVVLSDPQGFSKHQNRFRAADIGGLRPLYDRYLELLQENGHLQHERKPYVYGRFSDGEKIMPVMRRVYRRLFDLRCEHPLRHPLQMDRDLFNQPSEELNAVDALPVSRLMYEIWCMRPDLQEAFNLESQEGREGFIHWYLATATAEMGIAPRYVEPIRAQFMSPPATAPLFRSASTVPARDDSSGDSAPTPAPAEAARPAVRPRGPRYHIGQLLLRALAWGKRRAVLARWYQRMPQSLRMAVRRRAYTYSGVPLPPAALLRPPKGRREPARAAASSVGSGMPGVNMIGYARGEFGVAENVRSCARALDSVDYPFLIRNFEVGVASRLLDQSMERHFSETLRYDASVFFINADQMPVARKSLGPAAFEGRYNIGYWLWELEHFPHAWDSSFDLVDEVWVPTEFVRSAIAANSRKTVLKMPKAVEFSPPTGMDRSHFGLASDAFVFLFSYDFNGYAARKNPEAVLAAFRRAFADGKHNVRLLLKSINGERFPEKLAQLSGDITGDPRIELRDGFLSRQEMFGLQNSIDCYVSLHRSEGFGLGLAECMYLGKPVMATAYSGNLEFMTSQNSCLVDYRMVPVREGEYPYWQEQRWADADVDVAAEAMRRMLEEREWASTLAARGAADIRRNLSRRTCADAMVSRLAAIRRQRFASGP